MAASRRFTAVLFDLDGTLIDGYPAIAASANAVRARYGLAPLDENTIRPFVGRGLERLLAEITPGTDLAGDAAYYRQCYSRLMADGTRLLPGSKRMLEALAAVSLPAAICSNKLAAFSRDLLRQLGIAALIAAVYGPEMVSRPKPDPDMLLAAAAALASPPAATLYVGDMSIDVRAGRAAGMTVWTVVTGSESSEQLLAAGPDRLFDGMDKLREAFFAPALDSGESVG